jgi:hypothetical protein
MLPTTTTWRSHGQFSDPAAPEAPPSHRVSTLDHVYVSDVSGINPVATVLPDSTTDHRPVMVDIDYVSNRKATVELKRRNFKSINPSQFEAALSAWGWAAIHRLTDVDKAVKYLNDGVMAALDVAAPLRIIHVRHGKNVYLAADNRSHEAKGQRSRVQVPEEQGGRSRAPRQAEAQHLNPGAG